KLVELVSVLHKKGVPIVAGTDGLPSDLIRELELYVEAGMTPGEALETATDGAARAMKFDPLLATIAKGGAADLVLVDGDVGAKIGALRQVDTVMMGGKLMNGQALRESVGITGLPKKP
ncbi:MAG: amidohydrolase family protein, partial [Parvularculaceae bacterium]|nr:amidohydrolase family protein [Parvularculaceae bacterium]